MPSTSRRALLGSLGAAALGSLAGCSAIAGRSPPAGSLQFENDHTLPHTVRFSVTGIGAEPDAEAGDVTGDVIAPPAQRTLTASTTVSPGQTETYDGVMTEPHWYGVQFWLDGEVPADNAGRTRFNPNATEDGTWEFMRGHVYESGEFSWEVHTTDDSGPFTG